jgi:hypothetical protein
LREAPVFCWVELEGDELVPKKTKLRIDLLSGLKVRLARIEVLNCQLNSRVSIAQRQSARPAQTPYIASGTEAVKSLSPFTTAAPMPTSLSAAGGKVFTIKQKIDTSRAEFLSTPDYTAHITGPRQISINGGPDEVLILEQFHIADQQRASFDVFDFLIVITLNGKPQTDEISAAVTTSWRIIWMGVEA